MVVNFASSGISHDLRNMHCVTVANLKTKNGSLVNITCTREINSILLSWETVNNPGLSGDKWRERNPDAPVTITIKKFL